MRGKHATKPIEQVLEEARQLAADGVRELIVVAQDTTYFGMDLYGEARLVQLLGALEAVEGIEWIRLMYFYPMYVSDELIDAIARSPKILPYIDMPLQHIDDQMLRRMARRVTRAETEQLIDKLRQRVDRLALRTTFITGFPGETDEQFAALKQFVRERRFERAGVFTYSWEPDTPATQLPEHLPDDVKEARRAELMQVQQEVAFAWTASRVGQQVDVILDAPVPGQKNVWVGRSIWDAPDVDAQVYVTGQRQPLRVGQIVPCEVVATQEYDLIAVAVGAPR
jgi:ribosomal protein S12 methylthiotransferase